MPPTTKQAKISVFIIDPHARTISPAQIDNTLIAIYRACKCDRIDAVRVGTDKKPDVIFVDDEGLLKDLAKQSFFLYGGAPTPLAGYGVVCGSTPDGDNCDVHMSILELGMKVRFVGIAEIIEEGHTEEKWGFV